LIKDRCSVEEVMDLLGDDIGVGELCLRLRSHILDRRERFEDFLDIYAPEEEEVE
jgi:hypothetical protein